MFAKYIYMRYKNLIANRFALGFFVIFCFTLYAENAKSAEICASQYATYYAPYGYVITKVSSGYSSSCGVIYNVVVASSNGYTTDACNNSVIPDGFITTAEGYKGDCDRGVSNEGPYKVIKYPADTLTYSEVCSDSYIPNNWVITAKDRSAVCGSFPKMLIEKAVDSSYYICSGSPVPPGYLIVNQGSGFSRCKPNSSYAGNYWRISLNLYSGMTVCDSQHFSIPANYVITKRKYYSGCKSFGSGPAMELTHISDISSSTPICNGPYGKIIPNGYIVREEGNYSQCNKDVGTAPGYKISLPTNGDIVCDGSPLPANFVITRKDNYSQCNNGPGWQISTVSAGLTVCSPSPVPAGWGFYGSGMYGQCGPSTQDGWGYVIGPIQDGSTVCSGTALPSGWVVLSDGTYSQCGGTGKGSTIGLPNESGTTDICFPSTTPDGYVKSQVKSSYSQCAVGGWTIQKPNTSGETFICGDSPIPAVFAITREVTTNQCGLIPTGYYISLISGEGPYILCDGAEVPDGYVIIAKEASYSHCNGGGFTIILPASAGSTVCYGSAVPNGFVVVELTTVNECKSSIWPQGDAYIIQHPNTVGSTTICDVVGVPIPDGYLPIGSGNGSRCSPLPSTEIHAISQLAPAEFISIEADVNGSNVPPVSYDCSNGGYTPGFAVTAVESGAQCP